MALHDTASPTLIGYHYFTITNLLGVSAPCGDPHVTVTYNYTRLLTGIEARSVMHTYNRTDARATELITTRTA